MLKIPKMRIEVTTWTVIKILLAIIFTLFLYYIKDIILLLFVSVVLAAAFAPWTDWLEKRRIPRPLGILTLYLIVLVVILITIALLIPPLTKQSGQLAQNFPYYWQSVSQSFYHLQSYSQQFGLAENVQNFFSGLEQNLDQAASGLINSLISFFGGIAVVILTLVLTFYLVVEQNAVKKIIKSFTPEERQELILQIYRRIQQRLGWWLRGQVILAFIIGFLAYIGLLILRVDYPAILALVAGVTEIIPYLGPIVGAIPAVFIAFFQSPVKALLVIILYYIIQWTENNVIVPKVMQKATGLNPIVVIVAIMIGAKVAGIFGVLLAVPVATALNIVVEEYLAWQKEQSQA